MGSRGWPPEGQAGTRRDETVAGGNLPWFLPRSTRPSQLLCVSLPQTPPPKEPPGPTVAHCHLGVIGYGGAIGTPRCGLRTLHPSGVPWESGWLGSAEASLIPKRAPRGQAERGSGLPCALQRQEQQARPAGPRFLQ